MSDSTRRALLRRAIAVGMALPLVSALQAAPAWADDDDEDDDTRRKKGRDLRPAEVREANEDEKDDDDARLARAGVALGRFSAGLCRVSQASGFNASNPGTDSLTAGRVRLVGRQNDPDDDKIALVLRGAPADVSYTVMFAPANGAARESLGTVGPTSSRGSLVALTPSALSGANRVGTFVLVRSGGNEDGHDEFVSCVGD